MTDYDKLEFAHKLASLTKDIKQIERELPAIEEHLKLYRSFTLQRYS